MRSFLIILFVCNVLTVLPQSKSDTLHFQNTAFNAEEIEACINKKKINFDFELGTTFGMTCCGSFVSSYFLPEVSYPLNNRFFINGGAIIAGVPYYQFNEPGFHQTQPYNTGSYIHSGIRRMDDSFYHLE